MCDHNVLPDANDGMIRKERSAQKVTFRYRARLKSIIGCLTKGPNFSRQKQTHVGGTDMVPIKKRVLTSTLTAASGGYPIYTVRHQHGAELQYAVGQRRAAAEAR